MGHHLLQLKSIKTSSRSLLNTLLLYLHSTQDNSNTFGPCSLKGSRLRVFTIAYRSIASMAGGVITSGPGGRTSEYNRGRITPFVVLACFVGACTGLVFG